MNLTFEEQKMLDGAYGKSVQKSMEILTSLGDIYGAERMIPIKSVHMPGSSIVVAGEAATSFVEQMGENGTEFAAYTTLNTGAMDMDCPRELGFSEETIARQKRLTGAYGRMGGVPCHTCTPYLIGHCPKFGEHVAWGESSAIAFVNSVIGARTNREGGPAALAAAIAGRVPAYGYHLDENRFMDSKEPLGIAIDGTMTFNRKKGKYTKTEIFGSDESVIKCHEWQGEQQVETFSLKTGKIIYETPYYIQSLSQGINMIYPIGQLANVLSDNESDDEQYYRYFMTSGNHDASYQNIKSALAQNGMASRTLYDYAKDVENDRNQIVIIQVLSYGFIVLISLIAAANVFNTISTNISLRRREFAMLQSVGMTAGGLRRMMNYECLLYGSKSLLFGLPAACVVTYLIYRTVLEGYETNFRLPYAAIGIAVLSVFLVVFATMMYSMKKLKTDNLIDDLKNENI